MPVINITALDELKQMSGPEFINELIDTFLDDAPGMLEEMNTAFAAGDTATFRRAAHSMKSNAATFGAGQLADLAKELEVLGREGKLKEAADRLKSLEQAVASACDELRGLKS